MKKTIYITGITLLALTLTGCSDSNDFKPVAGMDGMDIYANACSSCHGSNGQGKFGFLLKLAGTDDSSEEISEKIINGGHIMPAFPNISQQEAEKVAAYLKAQ
ncbi:MAG: cytochrome c [Candidatus Thiodiazotropha sp. 6PLUC2]